MEIIREIRSAIAVDDDVDCMFVLTGLYMSGQYGGFSKQLAASSCRTVYQSTVPTKIHQLYARHHTVTAIMR